MKKGFTLIEIISVIIILGIILVIAVPIIFNVIDNSKMKAYEKNIEVLLEKSEQYIVNNFDVRPKEIGNTIEITLNDLITNNYISNIASPFNENDCSGYVLVTKVDENDYKYIPHINCNENINNSTEDGLILHYTFDDFGEPTENFISDGNFSSKNFQKPYLTAVRGTIEFLNMVNPAGNTVLKHTATGSDSYTQPYVGTTAIITSVIPNQEYTFSVYAKTDGENIPIQMYIFPLNTENTYSILETSYKIANKEWQRFDLTMIMPADAVNISVRVDNDGGDGKVVYWSGMQLEKKSYSTNFVEGIRTGIVKDYSIENRHSNLTSSNTPKWVFDEERKNGNYLFNNQTINVGTGNDFFPLNNFTISSWMKTPGLGNGMSINGIISITYGLTVFINSSGNLNFRMDNGTSIPAINVVKNLHDNKWHHISVLFDGTNQKIYIDGDLMITTQFNGWTGYTRWPTNSFSIGQENNNGSIYRFNGNIDDVRIYNRALTEEEIKFLYETTK